MRVQVLVLQIALFLLNNSIFAQTVEDLLEQQEETDEASEFADLLAELRQHPIDLNNADKDDLLRIPFLPEELVAAIHKFGKDRGFKQVGQLVEIEGMTETLFDFIKDFVTVTRPAVRRPTVSQLAIRSRISDRFERPAGYLEGTYPGSRSKIYNRARFSHGPVSGGILLEKDSGEKSLNDLQLWNLSFAINRDITLMAGSFYLQAGQGLVFWGPYGFSKGASTVHSLRRRQSTLKQYLSVDENLGLRGGAVAVNYKRCRVLGFVSRNRRDATPDGDGGITAFAITGLHRTQSEQVRKDIVAETSAGGSVRYRAGEAFYMGSNWVTSATQMAIDPGDPERQFHTFKGNTNWVGSIDFYLHSDKMTFFGECAVSKSLGKGALIGMILGSRNLSLAFILRSYDPHFHTFRGFAFGERNGQTQNERGYYCGIQYQIKKGSTFSAYYDIFRFPWRTYLTHRPAYGHDAFLQWTHRVTRATRFSLRVKRERRETTANIEDERGRALRLLTEGVTSRWRIQVDHKVANNLKMTSRVDACNASRLDHHNSGFGLSQRLTWDMTDRIKLATKLAMFDTDSYESAVYQYEDNVTGLMSNAALFGRGIRWYVVIAYNFCRRGRLEFKYSETYREDVDSIGSGPDAIAGPRDRRFTFQISL